MMQLIFNPGTADEERLPFTVGAGDPEDAIAEGRVERDDPFEKQLQR